MIEFILAILNGFIRRIDGADKSWAGNIGRKIVQFMVRAVPVVIGAYLLHGLWQPDQWYLYGCHIAFGALISGSMQRGYDGWEHFSFRQITQHYIAGIGYIALIPLSINLTGLGLICCLMAGLSHPILARTSIRNYTVYAEFLTGFFLLLPFAIHVLYR